MLGQQVLSPLFHLSDPELRFSALSIVIEIQLETQGLVCSCSHHYLLLIVVAIILADLDVFNPCMFCHTGSGVLLKIQIRGGVELTIKHCLSINEARFDL